MFRSRTFIIGLLVLLLTLVVAHVMAEVPQLINYQGRLTDAEGAVVPDGNYSVTFRIYDGLEVPISSSLWAEGQLVTVKDGLFAVILGSVVAFPANLFSGPERWLSLQVGLDPEMTPRSRLTSVAFAVHAATADDVGLATEALHATSADNAILATDAGHATSADKADVATTSLDKTIDAGELTQGTLNAGRFSAYDDLLAEGKIGAGSDQVAAGDHAHVATGMAVARDLSTVSGTVCCYTNVNVVKTLTIPGGTVASYFRVWWVARTTYYEGHLGPLQLTLLLNGTPIAGFSLAEGAKSSEFWAQRTFGDEWSGTQSITLSALDALEFTITAKTNYYADTYSYEIGSLIVIYDTQ